MTKILLEHTQISSIALRFPVIERTWCRLRDAVIETNHVNAGLTVYSSVSPFLFPKLQLFLVAEFVVVDEQLHLSSSSRQYRNTVHDKKWCANSIETDLHMRSMRHSKAQNEARNPLKGLRAIQNWWGSVYYRDYQFGVTDRPSLAMAFMHGSLIWLLSLIFLPIVSNILWWSFHCFNTKIGYWGSREYKNYYF